MSRHKKDGLFYFSFDTDFFYADKRVRALLTRYGHAGVVFFIYLLAEIYRNGYYLRWDGDSVESAMDDLNLTEGLIEQMMAFLCSRSLLVKISRPAAPDTVITSPGIQRRYQEAAKSLRRDVLVDRELWLLGEEETASFIKFAQNGDSSIKNVSKYGRNSSKSGKNGTKEKKEINDGDDAYMASRAKAQELLRKYWGTDASEYDIEGVRSRITAIRDGKAAIDEDRAGLLEYAFGCSADANARNWNYVQGVLDRLVARGIRTAGEAYGYDARRELGGV